MQCTKQTEKHKSAGNASGLKQYEVKWSLYRCKHFNSTLLTTCIVTCTLMINDKVMKISIFRIQLFSDTVMFRSYGLCQRAGRGEKTVGWVQPPQPQTTKSLGVRCRLAYGPLPLTVSCFSKIQIGFTFLVPAHLGSPGKRPLNGVCVGSMQKSWY